MHQSSHGVRDALGLQRHAELKMRKTNAQGLDQAPEASEPFTGFPPGPFPEYGWKVNRGIGIIPVHGSLVIEHPNRIEIHVEFLSE